MKTTVRDYGSQQKGRLRDQQKWGPKGDYGTQQKWTMAQVMISEILQNVWQLVSHDFMNASSIGFVASRDFKKKLKTFDLSHVTISKKLKTLLVFLHANKTNKFLEKHRRRFIKTQSPVLLKHTFGFNNLYLENTK